MYHLYVEDLLNWLKKLLTLKGTFIIKCTKWYSEVSIYQKINVAFCALVVLNFTLTIKPHILAVLIFENIFL